MRSRRFHAAEIKDVLEPVRDRPGEGEEDTGGRVYNHYKRNQLHSGARRGRARQEQHLLIGPTGVARRCSPRPSPASSTCPSRSPTRRRSPRPATSARTWRTSWSGCSRRPTSTSPSASAHRLHRRDRQDRAQVRDPSITDSRRGRAAGLLKISRDVGRCAAGRPQAPAAGYIQVHQGHPVICGALRRPREDHRGPTGPGSRLTKKRWRAVWRSGSRRTVLRRPSRTICSLRLIPSCGACRSRCRSNRLDEDALVRILSNEERLVRQYQKCSSSKRCG